MLRIGTVLLLVVICVCGLSIRLLGTALPYYSNFEPTTSAVPTIDEPAANTAPKEAHEQTASTNDTVEPVPEERESDKQAQTIPPNTDATNAPSSNQVPKVVEPKKEEESAQPVVAVTNDTNRFEPPPKEADQTTTASSRGLLGSETNPISMVIHVSGELGNHVSKITYAHALKWMLEEEYQIYTDILIEHQALSKWFHAARNVKLCFPAAREWSFEAANTDEFVLRRTQQEEWMGSNHEYFHFKSICDQEDCIREQVDFVVKNLHNTTDIPSVPDNYNITLPYISSDEYASLSYFNNRYYARIKEMWTFDYSDPDCCQELAYPDESVFHVRGFVGEMPKRGKRLGYEELSPEKIASHLFGHLQAGDKIAYTGRFPPEYMINYTNALQERGLEVRVVMNHNPLYDFCFLMSAQKELAGTAMSSFVLWAAYLGNATKARLYSVKSPIRIDRFGKESYFFRYNWTDPVLDRIKFEEYNSEEQDEVDRQANKRPRRPRLPTQPPSTGSNVTDS